MGKEAAIVMFLGVFYLRFCSAASLNKSNTDKSSLLALKAHIDSEILAKNWSQETSVCTWIGIGCSRRHPRVTSLDLSNMALRGTVAREIGNLSFLRFLDISDNNIIGAIPGEIGKLRRLRVLDMASNQLSDHIPKSIGFLRELKDLNLSNNYLSGDIPKRLFACVELIILDLSYNNLTGNIPKGFGNLSQLQDLYLTSNQLTGNIPSEFWNLSAIQWVGFGGNSFTGTIPPSIGNLSNLEMFDIAVNSFHGTIPPEIEQLSSLTWLNLGENKLNGEVPQSIFNLSSLQALSLAANNLSGSLPFSIDKRLPNIEEIYLDDNHFHGKIPNSISNLSRLTTLEFSTNSFTGHVPITLGNLRQLQFLNLAKNQLTNNISKPEQDFLSSLATSKYLKTIQISENPIKGVLPKSLGSSNLSAFLEEFHAHTCRIVSPLPNELGNLSNLMWLHLGDNDLTGLIPVALGHLRNLQKLDIYGNKLQGSISHVLCSLENLYSINLAENNLFGQLPRCLGNLSLLREINLADNAFNSNIPSTLWFHERIERVNFSNNFFYGSLSQDIGSTKSLIELDLSRNQLSGEIPSTVSQLQNLIKLSLSNNKFNGPIFESFADMKDLQHLDLSHNNLSGPIPKSLEALSYLNYFNVSFNDLSGEIPDTGPFVKFTADFFTGNKGLCGAPRFKVKECRNSVPTSSRKNKLLKYILPVISLVVIAALIFVLVLRCRRRNLSPSSLADLPLGVMHERISHLAILRATNNFDEENLIGAGSFGSVYKGNFSDAMVAAVKVFNLDVQGALKSFDTECQVMRRIRHRNLVKVITSCSNLDFKALLMAYMPNGNLEKWLYSSNYSLNIRERLGIMLDVASALEYLHEGYTYPIVHCDLKPNNILLDEDMVAHVGDFGIAKLLTEEQRMQQTRTLGTIGYMAPEYGSEGLVSTMVDVYSYGILLMEIFSRRKPIDEMFSAELTMKRWVSDSFPNLVIHIVDDELLNMNNQSGRRRHVSCLTSIIGLALECTADLPEERPTMKDVLVRIRKIKSNLSNDNGGQQQLE